MFRVIKMKVDGTLTSIVVDTVQEAYALCTTNNNIEHMLIYDEVINRINNYINNNINDLEYMPILVCYNTHQYAKWIQRIHENTLTFPFLRLPF